MNEESYTTTIEVRKPVKVVFDCIGNVPAWWSNDFEGRSANTGDEFVIHHPGQHYSKQKLTEVVPNEKIVWLVTESTLSWLKKDRHEWTGTQMIFELTSSEEVTQLRFTHEGLDPRKESYGRCSLGWAMVICEQLFNFITTGQPIS